MSRRLRRTTAAVLALLVTALVSACTPDGEPPPGNTETPSLDPARITLAVYGPDAVISAYTSIAARYTAAHPSVSVNVKPYPDHAAAMAALRQTAGTDQEPDIFLAGTQDLPWLKEAKANQRVDGILTDRNIDFGDGYERVGIDGFSADDALQCMPVDVSPLVVYYNARLVNLSRLRPPGDREPDADVGWRMADFVTAAQRASFGKKRGVYVQPDLDQIAPFVYSGGGQVVDDVEKPTTLKLSSGASADAMRTLLELVRDPEVTFTAKQLARHGAVSRFKGGQLGMILGYRSLTPELRQQEGLGFGVMPIPRIGRTATIARVSGLCLGPHPQNLAATGDFLAALVDEDSARILAATGYVTPANSDALHSDDFLQPTKYPVGSEAFPNEIRFTKDLPDGEEWDKVETSSAALLKRLFYDPVIDPLEDRLKAIDDASLEILSPPTSTPSPSSVASPSPSPG